MARKRKFTPSDTTPETPMDELLTEPVEQELEVALTSETPSTPPSEEAEANSEVALKEEPAKAEPAEVDPKSPVNLELRVGSNESKTPKELTKETIEVSVKKKLAKKTDEDRSDPFVPQAQLDNEVVQVAREKGFPLSRGTEIGARLLARARRPNG